MGYAKLHFTTGTTIANCIRDITGVVSGNYTQTNQLVTANQGLSEIVNSAGRGNWTLVYPSTVTASQPQILSAPCINGQLKYVRIGQSSQGGIWSTSTSTILNYSSTTSHAGIVMQSVTAAASATSVSNPSFVNAPTSLVNDYATHNNFTGNFFYLSWSSRHLLIIGNTTGPGINTALGASGCFEFNNLPVYQLRNVAPFCHAQWFAHNSWDTTGSSENTAKKSSFYIMNHYNVSTATATGAHNFYTNAVNTNFNSVLANATGYYPTAFTKNSSGANSMYLQPLFFHQHQLGIPHAYISDLSKVYRVQSGIGSPGDTLTVGADTYAYFPLISASAVFSLAVLKA